MPNISEWPNNADVSSLSQVLVHDTSLIPQKYYLSAKACAGILRRAAQNDKRMPDMLHDALMAVVRNDPAYRDATQAWSRQGSCHDAARHEDAAQDATLSCSHEAPIAFVQNTRNEVRLMGGDGQIAGALAASVCVKQQCYIAFPGRLSGTQSVSVRNLSPTLCSLNPMAVAQQRLQQNKGKQDEGKDTTPPHRPPYQSPRRLMPVEYERLQGFPDGWTDIPWRGKPAGECPDAPRYRAIGNSWATNNVRWVGERIHAALDAVRDAAAPSAPASRTKTVASRGRHKKRKDA